MKYRKDRMSGRERMKALLNYKKPDRAPINMITVGFPCVNIGKPIASGYKDPKSILMPFCGQQSNMDGNASNVFAMTKAVNDFGWYE